ncbi:MAG: penicillin-binding transpeptidase domain-containing protein [Myxococcota bacterium]
MVALRAVQLQVYQHAEMARLAQQEYLKEIRIPARRGHIYDRYGKALAISVDVPSVYANPMEIDDPRDASARLAKVLGIPLKTVYSRLASERLFVWLKRQVDPAVANTIRALDIKGVSITKESRRFYPHRELASHILGFTGVDSHGLEGIERQYDEALTGEPQVIPALRDARGNPVLLGDADPTQIASGEDVYLTLDLQIQHATEDALQRAIAVSKAKAASAVVLDVETAEILAMAVEPDFNPNNGKSVAAARRRNRAVTDMFEPGSTVKPFVAAAALDQGVVRTDERIFCENGSYRIGAHTIRDSHPQGELDLMGILQESSNIGAAKIGKRLGREKLHRAYEVLGFGQRTGVSFPGEVAGRLRDPASWSEVGLATMSFGHGVAVNMLQLAAAYRALAAGGMWRAPRLIKRVGSLEAETSAATSRRAFSERSARIVTDMLNAAQSSTGGYRAQVDGYPVAGKTGTSQKIDPVSGGYSRDLFVAVFGGFVPSDRPRAAIVVMVDEPQGAHSGGEIAAPVFSEIAAAAMRHMGEIPSGSVVKQALLRAKASMPEAIDEPVIVELKEDLPGRMPSFVGMTARQAMARFVEAKLDLELEVYGSGWVVGQIPGPGASTREAKSLRLTLAAR